MLGILYKCFVMLYDESSSSVFTRNEDDVFQLSVMCPEVTLDPDSRSVDHVAVRAGGA